MNLSRDDPDLRFCKAYLRTLSLERAEQDSGVSDGCARLRRPALRKRLDQMRDAMSSVEQSDLIRRLCELAFSRSNDAIRLAYMEHPDEETIDRLDLSAVSEFKRGSNGGVEIRFLDRVKAIDTLRSFLCPAPADSDAAAFLQALEDAGDSA